MGERSPVILVPGVMGSRLRLHTRPPGATSVSATHLWLPESHRLLLRSASLSAVSGPLYRAWVDSLNPTRTAKHQRVEPDRSNHDSKDE